MNSTSNDVLRPWGWSDFFSVNASAELSWGRIIEEHKGLYRAVTAHRELWVELSGRYRAECEAAADFPAVGDWVGIAARAAEGRGTVHARLERRSKLSRRAAGDAEREQVIAANVDLVFVATSCNQDLNLRRVERYLTAIWDSGATPVVLLTKADLAPDPESLAAEVAAVAPGVEVLLSSSLDGGGCDEVLARIPPGRTAVILGSSGVGKSTLVNRLLGRELQATSAAREDDDRGRHTTTSRRLVRLPSGGLLVDTPGMREFQLWDVGDEGLDSSFDDIGRLERSCRFGDCAHRSEPGCAVKAALEDGSLDAERYESWLKLRREAEFQRRKHDKAAMAEEKRKWKRIHMEQRRKQRG